MSNTVSGHGPKDITKASFSTKLLESPSVKSFLGGVISSTSSCILLQPLDLIKTRIQISRSVRHHPDLTTSRPKGLLATTVDVVKNERVFGLWQGLTPVLCCWKSTLEMLEDFRSPVVLDKLFLHSLVRTVPGVGLYFLSLHTIQTNLGWTELNVLRGLIVGALARCIVGTVLLPVTVVKTRFESKQYFYKSVSGALRNIHKHEGYKGLYSGLSATLLRDVPFSGLYLAFYSQAKLLVHSASSQMTMPIHFTCGLAAGILASSVTQPFDLIKTHMQLDPTKYPTFRSTFQVIVKNHGVMGLFAGMVPRCIRRTLMAALTWTVYEEMKVRLNLK